MWYCNTTLRAACGLRCNMSLHSPFLFVETNLINQGCLSYRLQIFLQSHLVIPQSFTLSCPVRTHQIYTVAVYRRWQYVLAAAADRVFPTLSPFRGESPSFY